MSKEQSSATAKALQAVRGMNDVLPDEASAWHQFEETARDAPHERCLAGPRSTEDVDAERTTRENTTKGRM